MALRTGIVFFIAAAFLGGCEALPWRDSAAPESADTATASEDQPGQDISTAAPTPPESPGPKKPVAALQPDDLVGLSEEEMLEKLGPPLDVRRESPATVWHYQRAGCELKLFFYPSLRDRRLQALTYEVTPSGDITMERCLQELGSYHNG